MRRCAQTAKRSWWEGAASDATVGSGRLCGTRQMTGKFTARRLLAGSGGGGVEVDRATDGGDTPLMQASFQGFVDVGKVLLEHGADPNKPRDDGRTPLLFTARLRRRGPALAGEEG